MGSFHLSKFRETSEAKWKIIELFDADKGAKKIVKWSIRLGVNFAKHTHKE